MKTTVLVSLHLGVLLDRVVLADFHRDPSGYDLTIYNHTGRPYITIAVEDNVREGGT